MTAQEDLETPVDVYVEDLLGRVQLLGQDRGAQCRAAADLDELDRRGCWVVVHIPDSIYILTGSFFRGCFLPSLQFLGELEFRRRYRIVGSVADQFEQELRHALFLTNWKPTMNGKSATAIPVYDWHTAIMLFVGLITGIIMGSLGELVLR